MTEYIQREAADGERCGRLNILALDTAFGEIAACILTQEQVHISTADASRSGKTRSTSIVPVIDQLLDQAGLGWQQLDLLAFGAGPGSFTGLRIGAATLAGINASLHLPVVHLSSLAITARQVETEECVQVLEDARAGEVFVGCYHHGQAMQEDTCLNWQDIQEQKSGLFCCHGEPPVRLDGWQRLPLSYPRSRALVMEAEAVCMQVCDFSVVPVYPVPVYLQLSQAERQAHGQG
ncbi:MAG: tRNA (adenosine(37)-N6)-threonylcarbamoyltransferase complex dimerization subunit type 1 TsaB [Mariprofundus sp.]